ncbi:MAG: anaerobic ribonucleoside-triphosphate reductase activating protein [Desulfuromonas sp.]|uniref:anaerobic ribonucleoside-triphosphate reductase activating protein n=1 Tax=Desulfuromonas sp. TaxID=892 RepID=UPI000CAE2138|nr:anaerobic ribonucleoside-triphosphate reductase activating protein [Desulfuromonas sp.]PLX82367.1 MAG: anaerobic ribonucleoside-triphosphate reductase activating protein [Desulfuromonas sp.]
MHVKGFQGTSLLDYPGRIASLVFFGGCNLTCPFCHNPTLVTDPKQYPDFPLEALLEELRQRSSFIDGVVISGGEPTVDAGLIPLLRKIRALGLLVKLDTNGLAPRVMKEILTEGLVDFVALDLKTDPKRYGELHSAPVDLSALEKSARLILERAPDYEIRTTCVPGFVEEPDIDAIGALVCGARTWVLQQFQPRHALAETSRETDPHPPQRLEAFAELARGYARTVTLRGL